jgi:transposase
MISVMIRLSDEQWERIREHFPEEHIPEGRPDRKPVPTRKVLEAVLWILNTAVNPSVGQFTRADKWNLLR